MNTSTSRESRLSVGIGLVRRAGRLVRVDGGGGPGVQLLDPAMNRWAFFVCPSEGSTIDQVFKPGTMLPKTPHPTFDSTYLKTTPSVSPSNLTKIQRG